MRQIALIEDRLTKQPFAVIVLSNNEPLAFGALGQGEVWANWANSEKMSLRQIQDSLDITLVITEPADIKDVDVEKLQKNFSDNTFADLKNEISRKSLLKIIETKTLPPFFSENSNEENDFNIDEHAAEETIFDWPLTDIGIAAIDVAYKQVAVDYKTKAFLNDINASNLAFRVKAARAIWDGSIPGGGGWRCPPDTPYGGQFTNRLGLGCTFGMMRRLGQGLVAASVRDIQKLNNDPNNIDKPLLYRAGRSLEGAAESRRLGRVEKYEGRVARRVEKLADRSAKEKLRAGAPSGRTIYRSLNPSMTRTDRARIAAGTVLARIGNDMRTEAFNAAMTRRSARRIPQAPAAVRKAEFAIDTRIPKELRVGGGIIPAKLSSRGGLLSRSTGQIINFDEMQPKAHLEQNLLTMKVDLNNIDGNGLKLSSLPDFITYEELLRLDSIAQNTRAGTSKPLMTIDDFKAKVMQGAPGGLSDLTRDQIDDYLDPANSLLRIYSQPDVRITDELRTNGGVVPLSIADNGIYHNEATGEVFDFQSMMPTSPMSGVNHNLIQIAFGGTLPNYISPNEYYGIVYGRSIGENYQAAIRSGDIGKRLNPLDSQTAAFLGDDFTSALLGGGSGRRGPSKRAIIANRLRQSAQDVLEPGRRKNRKLNAAQAQQAVSVLPSGTPSKPSGRRAARGVAPQKPGIVDRFNSNQTIRNLFAGPSDTERALREVYGRRPRSTDARRERAAKLMRRTAQRILREPISPENVTNYPDIATTYPSIPLRNVPGANRPSPILLARHFANADARIHPDLHRPMHPFSGISNRDWWQAEENFVALVELNKMLMDPNRNPLLPDSFDESHQDELQKVLDDWSNVYTKNPTTLSTNIDLDGKTWKYDTGKPSYPPVYIESADNLTAHLMDSEGNYLMSVVTVTDANGNQEVKYIASDYTKGLINKSKSPGKQNKPTFIQRVVGKFRKPQQQQKTPAPSTRARTRQLVFHNTRFGLRFAKTTTGPEFPGKTTLNTAQANMLNTVLDKEWDYHANRFAKALGRADIDTNPLREDEILDWIAELKKTDPKRAGIEETNLHNFIVLSQIVESGDVDYVKNLKPSLRQRVMTNAGISSSPVDMKKPRPFNPYGRNQGYPRTPIPMPQPGGGTSTPSAPPTPSAPSAPSAPPVPSAPPTPSAPQAPSAPVAPSVVPTRPVVPTATPVPRPAGTGPVLKPGVGNATSGIVFEPANGLYFDTNTNEYVEDLSNLPIDQHSIYTPKPLVINGGPNVGDEFPSLSVDNSGALAKHIPHEVVAPGVDPNTPSLGVTARPLTPSSKIHKRGVFSSFAKAFRAREDQASSSQSKNISAAIRSIVEDQVTYVDARGQQWGSTPGTAGRLNEIPTDLVKQLGDSAAQADELLTDASTLYNASPQLPLSTHIPDPSKPAVQGRYRPDTLVASGLDPLLPVGEFYLPQTTYGPPRSPKARMVKALNTALQLQHVADNPPSTMTQQEIADIKKRANAAWSVASSELEAVHSMHQQARDSALAAWRSRRTVKKQNYQRELDEYIANGHIAELAQSLLEKHVVNNPTALAAIENSKREALQDRAKRLNDRKRVQAARQAAGLPRNAGLYDSQPDILDPWNSPTPPPAPRQPSDIVRIRDEHRAETLFDKISQGTPSPLSDEQFEMFAVLGEMWNESVKNPSNPIKTPQNSPYAGKVFPPGIQSAHLGMVWQYNGYNSLPVLASRDELIAALKEVDANGKPKYVLISRGVGGQARATAAEQIQMVSDALTGDRFIPGQGGVASGTGEYWSQNPSHWSSYHGGNGGTMVALMSRDSRLTNRKSFGAIFGSDGGGGNGESYESLWAIYNAVGAPGSQGTNSSHGRTQIYGIAVDSLKPDPNTGQLNAKQLSELDNHIDRLTTIGTQVAPGQTPDASWGAVTLEGMLRDGRLPNGLKSLFPSQAEVAAMSPEEIQDIEDTKSLWNGWLHQRMTIARDILARLENEATGGQAAKDNNQRVVAALRAHLYTRGENVAAMMGYDGFAADGVRDIEITPSQIWKAMLDGRIDRFTMLNRSSMIMEDKPVKTFTDYKPLLAAITYPDGTDALRRSANWG